MILIAVESQKQVYVYDEKKNFLFSRCGTLYNYSDNFVAIKRNTSDVIDIYDVNGEKKSTYPFDFVDTDNIIGQIF